MSNSIDQKVVEAKFDNKQFERGVGETMSTLAKLKQALHLDGASKGLEDINKASKNFDASHMAAGVDSLASKFGALQVVGVTALATIANKAVNAGLQVAKSLTIGPISSGYSDYNEKLTSVQTIMNATGKDIDTVNGYFKQLDEYSDKTIYNLSDMTGAFAKFTNAGLEMDKSVPAIKGIANMVALAGQGAGAASIAMYNLSQSIAGGFLTTIDYKSLNLANVATKEWKNQMIAGAVAAGTLKKGTKGVYNIPGVKKAFTEASLFTEGLSEQWATTKVLTKVLGDYGDITTAIGRKAQAAAQNVKSLPMMMETLKAAVGTGWTDSFEYILGNVTESTKLFTGMTNAIGAVLEKASFGRNHMLHQWKSLGGRTAIIDAVSNSWKALGAILKPIGDAFQSVFPRGGAGQTLADFSFKLRELTSRLMIGKETAENLKKTFQGVFSILKIGTMILGGIFKGFFSIFGLIGQGGGGMLSSLLAVTAVIGDFATKIQQMLLESGAIKTFFTLFLSPLAIIKPLIGLVVKLADALISLAKGDISGFTDKAKAALTGFIGAFSIVGEKINAFFNTIGSAFSNLSGFLFNFASAAASTGNDFLAKWAGRLANLAGYISAFSETVRQKITNLISSFTDGTASGKNFLAGFGSGAMNKVVSVVTSLATKFRELRSAMDMNQAFTKLSDGAAVAGDSLSKMSTVGEGVGTVSKDIGKSLSSIGGGFSPVLISIRDFFTTLVGKISGFVKDMDFQDILALFNTGLLMMLYRSITQVSSSISKTFNQLTDTLKSMQQNVKATVILKIAAAVGIMAASLLVLSTIDPKALGYALAALSGLFIQLGIMLKIITKIDPKSMISTGLGMIMMANAVLILTGALKILSTIEPEKLLQSMIALGALFSLLTVSAMRLKGALPGASAILIIAGALAILAPVLVMLGLIPAAVLGQGLIVIAGALLILVGAAKAMTAALPGASAIMILAGALAILTPTLILFGLMPWENIGKAMVMLGGSLLLLVIAANAMSKALPGAAAILIMAGALAILTPALLAFGMMPLENIGKALLMLAGVFAIFVVAMYALAPVILVMASFSGSVMMLGAGLFLAGAGMLLFSTALAALAVSGAAGFAVLVAGVISFLQLLPLIAQQFGLALVAFAKVIQVAAPKLVAAFTAIMIAFLKSLQKTVPEAIKTLGIILKAMLDEIVKRAPQIYAAGLDLIIGFLKALRSRIALITSLVIDIFTLFLTTIKNRLPDIIQAGIDLLLAFMHGLAKGIRENKEEMADAGEDIGKAIVEGVIAGLSKLKQLAIDKVKEIAAALPGWAKKVLGINSPSKEFEKIGIYVNEGLIKGLTGSKDDVEKAFDHLKDIIKSAYDAAAQDVVAAQARIAKLTESQKKHNAAIRETQAELRVLQTTDTYRQQQAQAQLEKVTSARKKDAHAIESAKRTLAAADAAAKQDILDTQAKLAGLVEIRNKETKAIRDATVALNAAKNEKADASRASIELARNMQDEKLKLSELSDEYEVFNEKIKEANKVLEDAIKTRDDYNKAITTQYDNLPDINTDTTLTQYITDLQQKAINTQEFAAALQQLRNLGLSDEMYQELLKKGIDSMPFVQELLKGGVESVNAINEAGSALGEAAKALGNTASAALYQAGVDSAQGLVNGLQSQQGAIYAQMQAIANGMVSALKAALEIKSPSRVFIKMGAFSTQGLAQGLRDSSSLVEKAAEGVGETAITAMQRTLSQLGTAFDGSMDLNPTITPILDLTGMRKEAVKMGSMLAVAPISIDAAYASARNASAGYRENVEASLSEGELVSAAPSSVTFVQNNNSPKALSSAEIYRQTDNQLSRAKGALTKRVN